MSQPCKGATVEIDATETGPMELTNDFDLRLPVADTWRLLTDVAAVVPCLPGVEPDDVSSDEIRGVVAVTAGEFSGRFEGTAAIVDRDEATHRTAVWGEGTDTAGSGRAAVRITAEMVPATHGTHVTVTTDLTITGPLAHVGRGMLADASTKLVADLVNCLEANVADADGDDLAAPVAAADQPAEGASGLKPADDAPAVRPVKGLDAEPVARFDTRGGSLAKRMAPAGLAAGVFVFLARRRLRGR